MKVEEGRSGRRDGAVNGSVGSSLVEWFACSFMASLAAAALRVCQEPRQLAAGRVECTLLGLGLAVGEQRPAVLADEAANDLLDWPPAQGAVHLQFADDLTAEKPNVVAVPAQGLARQPQGQQGAQERLEAFHQPQTGRNIARLIRPTAWPLIEVRAPGLQGIGASLLRR